MCLLLGYLNRKDFRKYPNKDMSLAALSGDLGGTNVFFGRLLPSTDRCYGSIRAGRDVPARWSNPMQMAGQVECKWVLNGDENA